MYALATSFGVLSSVCSAMVPRLVTLWIATPHNFIHIVLVLHFLSGILAALRGGVFTFLADTTFARMTNVVLDNVKLLTMSEWEGIDKTDITKALLSHVGDVAHHTGLAVNVLYRTTGSFVVLTVFLFPLSKLLYLTCVIFAFVHVFTVWGAHRMYEKCLDAKRKVRSSFDASSKELVDHFSSFRYYDLVDSYVGNLRDDLAQIVEHGYRESYVYARLMVILSIVPKLLELGFMAVVMWTGHSERIWECVTYYHSASEIVNCVKDILVAIRDRKEAITSTHKYMSLQCLEKSQQESYQFSRNDVIKFENVCFSYPTSPNKRILRNFNLTIKSGDKIALVAKSGGGKTTIVKLIMGMYHVSGITLNGGAMRKIRIAIVPQDPVFFECKTIKENILLGRKGDDDAIERLLRLVNLDMDIHSKQAMLSGGQKQRLAIVRMLARDASFIVVDEPTSALDSETERVVMQALAEYCRDKTVIFITHNHKIIPRGYKKIHLDNMA